MTARFVEVTNTLSGAVERVPEDYLDNPVLGQNLEKTVAQRVADGEVEAEVVEQPPTEKDTAADIEAFADKARIDLGDAKTKADKVEVITAALAAAAPTVDAGFVAPPPEFPNPEVQLVHGDVDDQPIVPADRVSATDQDDTSSSDEEN